MAKLEFTLARGGVIVANIMADKVPRTWAAIKAHLPYTEKAYNARWSGRETHVPTNLVTKPPRENQILHASFGDVIYAYEWPDAREYTGFEAIAWFYGGERVRDWRGSCPVNLIGRVDQAQWPLLEQIGMRTWREGGEACAIRVIEE